MGVLSIAGNRRSVQASATHENAIMVTCFYKLPFFGNQLLAYTYEVMRQKNGVFVGQLASDSLLAQELFLNQKIDCELGIGGLINQCQKGTIRLDKNERENQKASQRLIRIEIKVDAFLETTDTKIATSMKYHT